MAEPNSSDFETDLASTILDATKMSLKRTDISLVPSISNGFTDSRFTRPLGVTTYGFSGDHPGDDPMLNQIHGTDESIGISSLINSTKIMLYVAYTLLTNTSTD
jgi:acetylornithine deacetylase/succinyl-diaminopimelate desuccinylase-like protein